MKTTFPTIETTITLSTTSAGFAVTTTTPFATDERVFTHHADAADYYHATAVVLADTECSLYIF